MARERADIENKVLELCAEDDYGSWELFWAISTEIPHVSKDQLQKYLIEIMDKLVRSRSIATKLRSSDEKSFRTASFSRERLKAELQNDARPDPNSFYWFGVRDPKPHQRKLARQS